MARSGEEERAHDLVGGDPLVGGDLGGDDADHGLESGTAVGLRLELRDAHEEVALLLEQVAKIFSGEEAVEELLLAQLFVVHLLFFSKKERKEERPWLKRAASGYLNEKSEGFQSTGIRVQRRRFKKPI